MTRLTLETEGDRHIVVIRRFAASPEAVYRAHTDPVILQRWLLARPTFIGRVVESRAAPDRRRTDHRASF